MNIFRLFKNRNVPKNVGIPRTGYVKRVSCGHYVLADANPVTYREILQTINHTEFGAVLGTTEMPVTLCDECAKNFR